MNINLISILVFIGFLLIGFVWGFFSGWRKVLYYGVFNVVLLAIFALVANYALEGFTNFLINNFSNYLPQQYRYYTPVVLIYVRQYVVVIFYIIAAVIMNIILFGIHMLFLRKIFKRRGGGNLLWRVSRRVFTAIAQATLMLPISFGLTGTLASGLRLSEVFGINLGANNDQANQPTTQQTKDTKKDDEEDESENQSSKLVFPLVQPTWSINQLQPVTVFTGYNQWHEFTANQAVDQALDFLNQFNGTRLFNQINPFGNFDATNNRISALFWLHNNLNQVRQLFLQIFAQIQNLFNPTHFNSGNSTNNTSKPKTPINSVDDFFNALKNASGEAFKNVTLTEEVKHRLLGLNPNLNQVITALNNIYNADENRIIFRALESGLSGLNSIELKVFDPIIQDFQVSEQLTDFQRQVAGFRGDALKYVDDQIKILVNEPAPNGLRLFSNNKLRVSEPINIYLKEFFESQMKTVFFNDTGSPYIPSLAQNLIYVFATSNF
ncbi:hypothetical protein J2Z62_000360 [Mycoplasmoides fastidiosum]|uniref:CvpA family protein n=1 Tax=Mycoplasmoides fastidiosum TaxID=92758 RepID=A0ABU0LYY4_9BACT|nr:hypothetical protein [Mycoplasmoides fastidiosum]MDQ0513922.1 hypothetical protein [Mycoplasmoides fastidiosum]UUD37664.1 hypothetical protein NPA10_03795 [Mycoplasmoides fastidiosum]